MHPPLIYALHSGNLYGTERMALATAAGLRDHFNPHFLAPAGPALREAASMGFAAEAFAGARDMVARLRPAFARHRILAVMATGVAHSLACLSWTTFYRRRVAHLHIVHGGTDERLSYGRKRLLNRARVRLVAVSAFVRERLIAHGVDPAKISVVENFLPDERIATMPRRSAFTSTGLKNLLIVSRIDPIKRVDLLLNALDRKQELKSMDVRIFGAGQDFEFLRARAAEHNPNVAFAGFTPEIDNEWVKADLLIHPCPEEPFGLAILEAMAAGVPVLVPDSGGAGSLVEDGVTGFRFKANQAEDLARRILEISALPPDRLNRIVANAGGALRNRFSAARGIAEYRYLLAEELQ